MRSVVGSSAEVFDHLCADTFAYLEIRQHESDVGSSCHIHRRRVLIVTGVIVCCVWLWLSYVVVVVYSSSKNSANTSAMPCQSYSLACIFVLETFLASCFV